MKRIAISVSILFFFLFTMTQNFAAQKSNKSESAGKSDKQQKTEDRNERMRRYLGNFSPKDNKAVKDAKAKELKVNEPNEPEGAARKFEGLEKKLNDVNRKSQREIRTWMNTKDTSKMKLATAVQRQVITELNLIRELAVEEGAVKTTAAIDGILADRQKRMDKMLKKLKEKEQKERTGARAKRRDGKESRGKRSRDKGRTNRQSDRDRYLGGR